MKPILRHLVFCAACAAFLVPSHCRSEEALAEPLRMLAPYVGKTWKGELAGSTAEKPLYDVSRWERAMNGQAVRILHSINDGEYGGESIVMWDPEKKSLVFWYFTTAGFFTEGTMRYEDGRWISTETVVGGADGVTEVTSLSEILPDGRMHTKARYLQKGQWVDGHEAHYEEDPAAKVLFK